MGRVNVPRCDQVIRWMLMSLMMLITYHLWYGGHSPARLVLADTMGGLGNQLFIVSAAASYAKRHSMVLVLDDRTLVGRPEDHDVRPVYIDSVFSKIPIVSRGSVHGTVIDEATFALPPPWYGNVIIGTHSYFQQIPPVFDNDRSMLRNLFRIDDHDMRNRALAVMGDRVGAQQTICIHFRFVDAATRPTHSSLTNDTPTNRQKIRQAMEHFLKLAPTTTRFVVFTSDLIKGQTFMTGIYDEPSVTFLDPLDVPDFIQFYSMIHHCDGFIAGTSTFVWWGIYFNEKPRVVSYFAPDPLLDYFNATYI